MWSLPKSSQQGKHPNSGVCLSVHTVYRQTESADDTDAAGPRDRRQAPSPLGARTRTRGNTARKQGCPRHLDQRQTTRTALSPAQLQPRERLCAHAAVNRQQRGSAGQSTEHRPPSRSPGRAVPSGAVPGRAGCGDQAQAAAGHSRRIKYRIQLVFSLEIQSIRRIT